MKTSPRCGNKEPITVKPIGVVMDSTGSPQKKSPKDLQSGDYGVRPTAAGHRSDNSSQMASYHWTERLAGSIKP